MLSSLENYYWRYTSASELVNMILAFVETRAVQVGTAIHFFRLTHILLLSPPLAQSNKSCLSLLGPFGIDDI